MLHLLDLHASDIGELGNLRSAYQTQLKESGRMYTESFENLTNLKNDIELTERILDLNLSAEESCQELNIPLYRYHDLLSQRGQFALKGQEIHQSKHEAREKAANSFGKFLDKIKEVQSQNVPFLDIITNGLLIEADKVSVENGFETMGITVAAYQEGLSITCSQG